MKAPDTELLQKWMREIAPKADYVSIRVEEYDAQRLSIERDQLRPMNLEHDLGMMVTVHDQGGVGYCASAQVCQEGFRKAFAEAKQWAHLGAQNYVTDFSAIKMPAESGHYSSQIAQEWGSRSLSERIDLLKDASQKLKGDVKIIDWNASLQSLHKRAFFVSNHGAKIEQTFHYVSPYLEVSAGDGSEIVSRSLFGRALYQQKGYEILDDIQFKDQPHKLKEEVLQLLAAPNCPDFTGSILLAPDQMILQIHESIGHPLETDRILGDERNYAGTSFVTKEMFGNYQYGSKLLNVSFDPSVSYESASYGFDDEGKKAQPERLIKDGVLMQPLGGDLSAQRLGVPAVANSRSCHWSRPPIDRMANLNLETGTSTMDDMISSIEDGVYMKTNSSWSIDDSRNKFQFGCEWAQLIKNGQLTQVVKKPNYRGISAEFWRNLVHVGDASTVMALGTPYCGKGEPNQAIVVGHRSPACVFENIEIFGGL